MSSYSDQPVGVLGAGSFGTVIANLLADQGPVLLYARRKEVVEAINKDRLNLGWKVHKQIRASQNLQEVCEKCTLIFIIVDSSGFSSLLEQMSPFIGPQHLIIHGTKGLHINNRDAYELAQPMSKSDIKTMSQLITSETIALRVGCLSGPNLAVEIAEKQPAATVIASRFNEIITLARQHLQSSRFRVYSSNDVFGIELAGVLKNIYAIAAGMVDSIGLGQNAKALLISRGFAEMVQLCRVMGSDAGALSGVAGIGDLIATCASRKSRNFSVGYRLGKGESISEVIASLNEPVEGLRTTKIAYLLSQYYQLSLPIVGALYNILYQGTDLRISLARLMEYGYDVDVDFSA